MKEVRVSAAKFRLMAEAELARIPPEVRALLGLYCGPEREDFLGGGAHGRLPAKVYLYQWNLEDSVGSLEELQKEIRLTLRHELAHHFGFDDDELERVWPEGA